jgi:hypothetical protein
MRHKAQVVENSPLRPRACPLCRSVTSTGLTPSHRPQPAARGGVGGGFVSGWALHGEMVRRAAAARSAVRRSLAARGVIPGAAGGTPSPDGEAPFVSPGGAYEAVQQLQQQQSQQQLSLRGLHARNIEDRFAEMGEAQASLPPDHEGHAPVAASTAIEDGAQGIRSEQQQQAPAQQQAPIDVE